MNNLGTGGLQPTNGKDPVSAQTGPEKPPSPENKPANGPAPVSRAPLNLGGAGTAAGVAQHAAARSRPAPGATAAGPAMATEAACSTTGGAGGAVRPVAASGGADRITGCKTFFTKLHPGAIDFLDEQINQWLKDNPAVIIKMTNTTTGEVQGKKTEANILMTVWYHGQATKSVSHMG